MESTISARAARPAAAATMDSTWVSAISRAVAAPSPRRRALKATWFSDSSPVAYSTRPGALSAARDRHIRVYLPIPGSPPIRVTDPATRPPPSTRSSSAEPVSRRRLSTPASSAREVDGDLRAALPPRRAGPPAPCSSATRVFHSPQAAHWPCHLGDEPPHDWQTKTSLDLAMHLPGSEFVSLTLQSRLPDHL